MRPEDARTWLVLVRDLLILAVGVTLLTLGLIYTERALVIAGVVLVVVASGLTVRVEIQRRNGERP